MKKLTPKMHEAIELMRKHGITYQDDPDIYAVVTTEGTCLLDSQPWINWRTAQALERRGLGKITGWGEETEFALAAARTEEHDNLGHDHRETLP